MKFNNLHELSKQMRKTGNVCTVFPCTINDIDFDIYYNIGVVPFRLLIVQLRSNFCIDLIVENGYEIDSRIDNDKYSKLCKILGLKYDPEKPFSPSKFFSEIDKNIPSSPINITDDKRASLYTYVVDKKERTDGQYYLGKRFWANVSRSKANSEKVQFLLPEVWNIIKDVSNLSICFTNTIEKRRSYKDDFN